MFLRKQLRRFGFRWSWFRLGFTCGLAFPSATLHGVDGLLIERRNLSSVGLVDADFHGRSKVREIFADILLVVALLWRLGMA